MCDRRDVLLSRLPLGHNQSAEDVVVTVTQNKHEMTECSESDDALHH